MTFGTCWLLFLCACHCCPCSQSHLGNLSPSNNVALCPGGKAGKKIPHSPPVLASAPCLNYGRRPLLFCGSLIGFRVVLPSTHLEHNDSFNRNHGKRRPRAVVQSIQAEDGDLLSCVNMVSASHWQANGQSVHVGHQASLLYWKWPMKEEVWIWHERLVLSTHLGWKSGRLSTIAKVHEY